MPTTEAVPVTRARLNEIVTELHEPKPPVPPDDDWVDAAYNSPRGYWWLSEEPEGWFPAKDFVGDIALAWQLGCDLRKVMNTDVKDRWFKFLHEDNIVAPAVLGYFPDADKMALLLSQAFVYAMTGTRYAVVD